ncbi:MAG: T9SS type A sorting domain-containing protein [Saprospiraceae bacterium]|nr:T9SS type A sorting domain-containing protein [Saprospiraceae bacterium]
MLALVLSLSCLFLPASKTFYSASQFHHQTAKAVVKAPADLVVGCDVGWDLSQLRDPMFTGAGRIHADPSMVDSLITLSKVCAALCEPDYKKFYPGASGKGAPELACQYYMEKMDSNHPDSLYSLFWGMEGYASGVDSFEVKVVDLFYVCGLGLIDRVLVGYSGFETISDTQRIWFLDCNPFYINLQNLCDPEDDLIWDEPFCDSQFVSTIYACGMGNNGSSIQLRNTNCANFSFDFKDEFITDLPGVCARIVRTHVIINWCEYDPLNNPSVGRWEFKSKIDVADSIAPHALFFETQACMAVASNIQALCGSPTLVKWTGFDNCGSHRILRFSYKIDFNDDHTGPYDHYDVVLAPSTLTQYQSGDSSIQLNKYAFYPTHPFDASGIYPLGRHRIEITVDDRCGNKNTFVHFFESKDCVPPRLECKTDLPEIYLSESGIIRIDAKELISGVIDNCSNPEHIILSFLKDSQLPELEYDCHDFAGRTQLFNIVQMYALDESGNADSCQLLLSLIDSDSICAGFNTDIVGPGDSNINFWIGYGEDDLIINGSDRNSVESFNLEFLDLTGKKIEVNWEVLSTRQLRINTSNLTSGYYVIRFWNLNKHQSKLFVKF